MKLTGSLYRIAFLNIPPDYENELRSHFEKARGSRQTAESRHVVSAFGPFDVAIISEILPESLEQPLPEYMPIAGVTSAIGFEFENITAHSMGDVLKEPVLLVSCLKIHRQLVHEFGIDAERLFLELCHEHAKNSDGLVASFLGSFGWYELILVLGGRDIRKLVQFLISLRNLTTANANGRFSIERNSATEEIPFLETSFSVPCINDDLIHFTTESDSPVHARVMIVCKPGCSQRVAEKIPEIFGAEVRYRNPLGQGEFMIPLELPFSQLSTKLLDLRNQHGADLVETLTSLEFELEFSRTYSSPLGHSPETKKIEIGSIPWSAIDSYTADRMRQVFTTFNGRISNALVADCFSDLVPFVTQLAKFASSLTPDLKPDSLRIISEQCDSFFYGMEQRFHGSYLALLTPNLIPDVRYGSGIHRILVAGEQLTSSVLQSAGLKWDGFCVAGLRDYFCRFDHGVINLPWDALFRPELWWQMFHEAGHEFGPKISSDPELHRLLKANLGIDMARLDDEKNFSLASNPLLFLWELIADLIDFSLVFESNLKNYLGVMWKFLDANHPRFEYEIWLDQLIRTLLLIDAYEEGAHIRGNIVSIERFNVIWKSLPETIDESVKLEKIKEHIQKICDSSAPIAYERVGKWLEIHRHLRPKIKAFPLLPINDVDAFAKIIDGEPVWKLNSPASLIRELAIREANGNSVSRKARVAAILSLWSTWKTTNPNQGLLFRIVHACDAMD